MEFISRKTAKFWLSKVVLRTSNQNEMHQFRALEKTNLKLLNPRSRLLFSETTLNIYIYIYIYSCVLSLFLPKFKCISTELYKIYISLGSLT